jgi:glucose/arabinose dehydrogenase
VQRGHITRDIAFSNEGRQMFVSVGSSLRVCVMALSTAGPGTIWAPTKIRDIAANGRT